MLEKRNGKPGFDGGKFKLSAREMGTPDKRGRSRIVAVNARESNARSLNLNGAQTRAYDDFWSLAYKAGFSWQMAMDPSREYVDTSGVTDPIPASTLQAATDLGRIRNEPDHKHPGIGADNYTLVWMTCIMGFTLKELAEIQFGAGTSRPQRDRVKFAVHTAYNALAVYLGHMPRHKVWKRLQAYMEDGARPQDRPDMRENVEELRGVE